MQIIVGVLIVEIAIKAVRKQIHSTFTAVKAEEQLLPKSCTGNKLCSRCYPPTLDCYYSLYLS